MLNEEKATQCQLFEDSSFSILDNPSMNGDGRKQCEEKFEFWQVQLITWYTDRSLAADGRRRSRWSMENILRTIGNVHFRQVIPLL